MHWRSPPLHCDDTDLASFDYLASKVLYFRQMREGCLCTGWAGLWVQLSTTLRRRLEMGVYQDDQVTVQHRRESRLPSSMYHGSQLIRISSLNLEHFKELSAWGATELSTCKVTYSKVQANSCSSSYYSFILHARL